MTTTKATAPQVLTRLIDRVEEMSSKLDLGSEGDGEFDSLNEFVKELSIEPAYKKKYGSLDKWETDLATLMVGIAVVEGLGETKDVEANFKALDKGTHFLTTTIIEFCECDVEVSLRVNEMTNSLVQLFILASTMVVRDNQGQEAANELQHFISDGSAHRMKVLMDEAPKGFGN